jgi:hypothetical protein
VSRGSRFFEIFREGVPPVEAVLGGSRVLGRRIERSAVFPDAKYRHDSA